MGAKHLIRAIGHELVMNDIIKADNCYLYDSKGNKYIDLESGIWCTGLGHSNPRINSAIKSQLDKISHTGYCYSNPANEDTAGKVLEIANLPDGKCEFLCSGSEAVEFCVRIAKATSDHPMILSFSDSYFGAYGEASKKNPEEWYKYNWQKCSCQENDEGCIGDCLEFADIPFDKIGAFLFEPGSSSGLVKFPSQKLISKISERIRENNGLLIVNEVTTGIGRTGKWFGYMHYNLSPDMIALGKGIGNGYPVSIAVISAKTAATLEKKNFKYAQSHQNDPLGAVVAGEVIDTILDENLIERSGKLGRKIIDRLNEIKRSNPLIKEVRGRGLMIAIELQKEAGPVQKELLQKGFILVNRPDHEVLRMDPALTIKEKDIDLFLASFEEIIQQFREAAV